MNVRLIRSGIKKSPSPGVAKGTDEKKPDLLFVDHEFLEGDKFRIVNLHHVNA